MWWAEEGAQRAASSARRGQLSMRAQSERHVGLDGWEWVAGSACALAPGPAKALCRLLPLSVVSVCQHDSLTTTHPPPSPLAVLHSQSASSAPPTPIVLTRALLIRAHALRLEARPGEPPEPPCSPFPRVPSFASIAFCARRASNTFPSAPFTRHSYNGRCIYYLIRRGSATPAVATARDDR